MKGFHVIKIFLVVVSIGGGVIGYNNYSKIRYNNPEPEITINTCRYEELTLFLLQLEANYSTIARLNSIGKSVEGRDLWVFLISDHPTERQLLRPQVKFVGNVIGNHGPSCYVLLRLITHLLKKFKQEDSLERRIIEMNEIHILPNMNPDGFLRSIPGECKGGRGRYNAAGKDLNRDFPDFFNPNDGQIFQPETLAIMEWISRNSFALSISLMSGAKVVSYPYDSSYIAQGESDSAIKHKETHANPTADDEMFQHLAKTYVRNVNETIEDEYGTEGGWFCAALSRTFRNGIINGAEWSHASGTMLDYNYAEGVYEIMVGITCCRNENNTSLLDGIWETNKQALLNMMLETQYGVRGQVIDGETHVPISGASMVKRSSNHDSDHHDQTMTPVPWRTTHLGEFWRLLLPGKYILEVHAEGYKEKAVPIEVKGNDFTNILVELERVLEKPTEIEHNHELEDNSTPDYHTGIIDAMSLNLTHEEVFLNVSDSLTGSLDLEIPSYSKYNQANLSSNSVAIFFILLPMFKWIQI